MVDNARGMRLLMEDYRKGRREFKDSSGVKHKGERAFSLMIEESLGLTRDEYGRRKLSENRIKPEAFSIRSIAEAVYGEHFAGLFDPAHAHERHLAENAVTTVMPGAFSNISPFNSAVGNLLEAKILEGYQSPEFIGDNLCTTVPTRLRVDRHIGIHNMKGDAPEMQPGQAHPRFQLEERWIQTPETKKHGSAIDITNEAVFFDITGLVLENAGQVGYRLGLRKERAILRLVAGIENSYNEEGTAYNTYLGAGAWVNWIQNVLVDWTDLDLVDKIFMDMVDPNTGEPIVISGRDMLVMPSARRKARQILGYTEVESRTDTSTNIGRGPNPIAGDFNEISTSQWLHRELVAAGASSDDARQYWYVGDFKRAFGYSENWAMNVQRIGADSYKSKDHDLVLSIFCNEMGTPFVREPRCVIKNTPGSP